MANIMLEKTAAISHHHSNVNVSFNNNNNININTGHVGQKRLQSAITAFLAKSSTSNINVEWKPYIIAPDLNPNGEEFEAYCIRRWGSSSWTNRLKQEGRKNGTGANFSNWKWFPNTMKSHRLIKFAKEKYNIDTSQSNEALFHALYEEGENLSLNDVLVKVGMEQLNLPNEHELREYLEGDEGEDEVQSEIRQGKRMYQISGVPFFVIEAEDGGASPFGISGAQEKDTFLEIFDGFTEG